MKVTIPWDKPGGISDSCHLALCQWSVDLRPSVKVTIPWDKPGAIPIHAIWLYASVGAKKGSGRSGPFLDYCRK
jgi:hypothetical protein